MYIIVLRAFDHLALAFVVMVVVVTRVVVGSGLVLSKLLGSGSIYVGRELRALSAWRLLTPRATTIAASSRNPAQIATEQDFANNVCYPERL
jgi:hypothetical protein